MRQTNGEQNSSTMDISRTFCRSAQQNFAALGVLAYRKLIPWISRTLVQGSRDTMRRHASVLHWYTCKMFFRQFPHVCRQF